MLAALRFRTLAAALLAATLVTSARALGAQGPNARFGTVGSVEAPTAPWACHTLPNAGRAFDHTCVGPSATGEISARVDGQNQLHASSRLFTPAWHEVTEDYRATASAYMFDRIEFQHWAPATLKFKLKLHGRVNGGPRTEGELLGYGWEPEPIWALVLGKTGGTWRSDTGTFVVPVVNNVAAFGMMLKTAAWLKPRLNGVCEESCSHAYADFSHTASVESITGFDADGIEITSGLRARTASGVSYALTGGEIVTTTPEPASLALMGAGLVPLVWLVDRRRRAPRAADARA